MTWTAHATVTDVSDGPAPIDVLAIANADTTVIYTTTHAGDVDENTEVDALVNHSDVAIRSVEVRLVLDQDETTIAVGDVIRVSNH
jgi:hypothetical protein